MKKTFLFLIVMLMILGFTYSLGEKVVLTIAGTSRHFPIARVNTQEEKLAFTFNVTSLNDEVDEILKELESHNIKATFFITEDLIKENPNFIKEIHHKGHEIGWLAFNHYDIQLLTLESVTENIEEISTILKDNIGEELNYLRSVQGFNDTIIVACNNLGIKGVLYDIDSNDTKKIGVDDIVQRVTHRVSSGSIVLFTCEGEFTREALHILIPKLSLRGYQIVPLAELIYDDNYQIDNQGEQRKRGE